MARVPLKRREDLPDEYQYLLSEDALGERNIFRVMGNNPATLQSYMRYGTTLWTESGLSERERELVILALARALDSRYEWHQHVELGREAGVKPWAIDALGRDDVDAFDGRDRALVAYARAFAAERVTDKVHASVAEHCDDETVTGLAMLASHYVATATVLNALAIDLEEPFVGWTPGTK
jgi:4-carboxymuconolactone decarboxylase